MLSNIKVYRSHYIILHLKKPGWLRVWEVTGSGRTNSFCVIPQRTMTSSVLQDLEWFARAARQTTAGVFAWVACLSFYFILWCVYFLVSFRRFNDEFTLFLLLFFESASKTGNTAWEKKKKKNANKKGDKKTCRYAINKKKSPQKTLSRTTVHQSSQSPLPQMHYCATSS